MNRSYIRLFRLLRFRFVIQVMLDFCNHIFIVAYTGANAALYSQVRQAINQGNLGMAEALLQRAAGRDAEWFYLTGTVYYRKGWYDEAARAYTQACQMDPSNAEYQHALQNLHLSGGYGGYRPMQETSMCDCCVQTLICNCCLNMCCGGGGC